MKCRHMPEKISFWSVYEDYRKIKTCKMCGKKIRIRYLSGVLRGFVSMICGYGVTVSVFGQIFNRNLLNIQGWPAFCHYIFGCAIGFLAIFLMGMLYTRLLGRFEEAEQDVHHPMDGK